MRYIKLCMVIALLAYNWQTKCFAETLPDSKVIPAILGEAGQSYAERLAIACAIRSRGTLHGVFGHLKAPSEAQWQNGSKAWHEALETPTDPVKGATHWLSDWDLKHCRPSLIAWRKKMIETAYIGHTHFYKEIL